MSNINLFDMTQMNSGINFGIKRMEVTFNEREMYKDRNMAQGKFSVTLVELSKYFKIEGEICRKELRWCSS